MSRDRNERGHVSQYETFPIPLAFAIPSLPKPYRATCQWQYPPTDTPPSSPSIHSLATSTALPSSLSHFTIHSFPGPCHKYLNSNVDTKRTEASNILCTTPSNPASTSTYVDQAQYDIALVNVKTLPPVGRDENIDKRDTDNVKGKRAPQITNESVLNSAVTASNGSPSSLSQSSPTRESVTGSGPSTSFVSSSIFTLTTIPVPGSSAPSTPPTFTSLSTTVTPNTTTTAFPLTSALANSTTPANGATSPNLTSTPLPTTGTTTTTISSSPDPRSFSTSMTTSRTGPFRSIPASSPTIISPTSPFTPSISGLPTSLTFTTPISASIPLSSITTSDSVTVTNITSFTSSFITTPFSSPDSGSTSFESSNSQPLAQSSTPLIFPSSITNRVTSTKVYTSTLPGGGMTVVTTVVRSGVLSTNTSLSGNRFGSNTSAVIAVAVCATVGVIIFVFVLFFLCKRYRERKERQKRRKSRRSVLRLPSASVSGRPGTGDSGGSGRVGSSRAGILRSGSCGGWSRSRSGEAVMEGPSEDGEDEEDVWRSPLVGEDDDVVMGMGGGGFTTPPESGEGKPIGGRKSSCGHQSGHSHSVGHSRAHSQTSSAHHGQGQGVPPSMAEFGVDPASYAAYVYPPALAGYPAYHSGVATGGGGGEGSGAPGGGEGQSGGLDSHGTRASYGAFVPYGVNVPLVPYPSPVGVSSVGTSCHVIPTTNVVETKDKTGRRPDSSRRESEGEASSAAGAHAAVISASTTTATAVGTAGLVSASTTRTSESRRTSGSKGSLRSIGSKSLRGIMDRIRTSVPNIQTDGVLPTRRSSKDMSSPSSASASGGETRPGYDYGVVGRPRRGSSGVHAPPPVAFVYPGSHITPPAVLGVDVSSDLPSNPQVDISKHSHGPIFYGYPVPAAAVNGGGEGGVDEDEDDSLRITSGVVTHGLLDSNISLIGGGGGDGGSVGGRSSLNIEGRSIRDDVDYTRRIRGMVKNHVTKSTTTLDQDGSIHFFPSGGSRPPTAG